MTVAGVSEREGEVLAALGERLTNAEIAARLHISIRTVETHVSSLLRKLDATDRRALAVLAREQAGDVDAGLRHLPSGTVTFLMTDVEGSTRLWEREPEVATALFARHDELAAKAVTRCQGILIQARGEGDSTFSVFESSAAAMVGAAELLRDLAADEMCSRIRIRAAIYTGEVDARDGDYRGPAPNRCARLRGLAAGGQVLVSDGAAILGRDLLGDGIELRDLGRHQLRDVERPERVHQLVHPDLEDNFPPLQSVGAGVLHGAPATVTSFIARDQERAELSAALGTDRVVTLIAPGGMGKTRLAIAVAADAAPTFSGGATFVDLVPAAHDTVMRSIADALGVVPPNDVSLDVATADHLAREASLLVLDNCEHVIEAAAAAAAQLTGASPVTVLATSRERLAVPGERLVVLPPLPVEDDAVALFCARARAVDPAFEPDTQVVDLCRQLEGMPLPIELAAARVGALGIDGLLAGLDDRLRLLRGGRQAEARHRSVQATIDWSYELLDDAEQATFRSLGVFAGAFDLAAALAVAGDNRSPAEVAEAIGNLADKSMIVRRSSDRGSSRWRLLETLRAYALDRLDARGEIDDAHARHLVWAADTVGALDAELCTGGSWRDELEDVLDDLRAAFARAGLLGHSEAGSRLGGHLGHVLFAHRSLRESQATYELAARLTDDPATAGTLLRSAADVAFAQLRGDAAYDLLQRAARSSEAGGDTVSACLDLAEAVMIGTRAPAEFPSPPDPRELRGLLDRAVELQPPDEAGVALRLEYADACLEQGLSPEDPTRLQGIADAAEALGEDLVLSPVLNDLSLAALEAGDAHRANELAQYRLEVLERVPRHELRTGAEWVDALYEATQALLIVGEPIAARAMARRLRLDDAGGIPFWPPSQALIPYVLCGAFDDAVDVGAELLDAYRRAGSPTAGWMAPAVYAMTMVHGLRGEPDQVAEWQDFELTLVGPTARYPDPDMQPRRAGIMSFVDARVALHSGDLAAATTAAAITERAGLGMWNAYARAVAAEVAVVTERDDAPSLIEAGASVWRQNRWADACIQRAAARLNTDEAGFVRAAELFDTIGARFEWACTRHLLGDEAMDAVFAELGVQPPHE